MVGGGIHQKEEIGRFGWLYEGIEVKVMEVHDCLEDGACLLDGYETSIFYDVDSTEHQAACGGVRWFQKA